MTLQPGGRAGPQATVAQLDETEPRSDLLLRGTLVDTNVGIGVIVLQTSKLQPPAPPE